MSGRIDEKECSLFVVEHFSILFFEDDGKKLLNFIGFANFVWKIFMGFLRNLIGVGFFY